MATPHSPVRSALLLAPVAALLVSAAFFCCTSRDVELAPGTSPTITRADRGTAPDATTAAATNDRGDTQRERGFWIAPIGARFVHHMTDRCDFEIANAESGTQSRGTLRSLCDVETLVVDRRDGETLLRQQIHGLQFLGADGRAITDDPLQKTFDAAAVEPVFVRIAPAGQILGFGFAAKLDGDQRNFLRGMLNVFAFEAPPASARLHTVWTSDVADTTGEYHARYELATARDADEVVVQRTRDHYTAIAGHEKLPKHELRGTSEGRFAPELGWLRAVRLDEGMTLTLPLLDLQAISHRVADVTLTDSSITSIGKDVVIDWAAANAPATGRNEVVGGYAADNERRRWKKQLENVTLEQLVAELDRLLAASPVDPSAVDAAFQQMQWLIKLDDTKAAAIEQQITTRQLATETARVALGALGAAGTDAAQNALGAVRSDASVSGELREAATIACVQLAEPVPSLIDGLVRDAEGSSSLQSPSMLVLGALAPKAKNALADGRSPVQKLLAMEADAAARGDLSTWLFAIGNAAPPETLAIVQRYVDNTDPRLRAAACVALRRVVDVDAVPILADRATKDVDADVRRDAVLELGRRNVPAARAALQFVAQNDANEDLRDRARRCLGEGA